MCTRVYGCPLDSGDWERLAEVVATGRRVYTGRLMPAKIHPRAAGAPRAAPSSPPRPALSSLPLATLYLALAGSRARPLAQPAYSWVSRSAAAAALPQ